MPEGATEVVTIRKVLTANDTGSTRSHQAGIHVPMTLVRFFPALAEQSRNPDAWLTVRSGADEWSWRYIHYNKARFGEGTRDEYRLTHVSAFMSASRAMPGDVLALTLTGTRQYRARIESATLDDGDIVVLVTSGAWRVVRLGR